MEPALPADRALDYLRELSTDFRHGALLDASGRLLAGSRRIDAAAREFADACADAAAAEVGDDDGFVFMAADSGRRLVMVTGPFALGTLVRLDMAAVLAALDGRAGPEAPAGPIGGAGAAGTARRRSASMRRWLPDGTLETVGPGHPRHASMARAAGALLGARQGSATVSRRWRRLPAKRVETRK